MQNDRSFLRMNNIHTQRTFHILLFSRKSCLLPSKTPEHRHIRQWKWTAVFFGYQKTSVPVWEWLLIWGFLKRAHVFHCDVLKKCLKYVAMFSFCFAIYLLCCVSHVQVYLHNSGRRDFICCPSSATRTPRFPVGPWMSPFGFYWICIKPNKNLFGYISLWCFRPSLHHVKGNDLGNTLTPMNTILWNSVQEMSPK